MYENITTIIVAIIGSGVLNTILNYLISIREKRMDQNSGEKKSIRLIMKNNVRALCDKYIQQGWIYEDELEDLIAMHKCYHDDLGGNGFLDKLMSKVMNLEIRGIGVK